VLAHLAEAGFESQLVGGCVRDLMLGREPKDFDVVTDARPEQIRKLFRNAWLIGRRFRLVHVRFGREVIEVTTYRAAPDDALERQAVRKPGRTAAGRLIRDNVFGSQEEDALRRDFTVNALYFDSRDVSVIDYVGGVEDLRQGVLRTIGDPESRFREDPVRMLRAVRFAARLGFRIDELTAAPIRKLAVLLQDVPPARLFEEVLKLFHGGYALSTYELLRHYHLFEQLFPLTEKSLEIEQDGYPLTLLPRALANTDKRVAENKPVTPAFLFAAVLWEPVRLQMQNHMAKGVSRAAALELAGRQVLAEQARRIAIPKRFSVPMCEIWTMQRRLVQRTGQRAFRLLEQRRFRAAYDFLLLRAESGEEDQALGDWWTRFQEVDPKERQAMVDRLAAPGGRRRKRARTRKPETSH